jgi:hypothetical protein
VWKSGYQVFRTPHRPYCHDDTHHGLKSCTSLSPTENMNGKDREERRSDSYQESRDVHVVDHYIMPKMVLMVQRYVLSCKIGAFCGWKCIFLRIESFNLTN